MELIVKGSFLRDISAYTNRNLLKEVYDVMQNISSAESILNINNLKKLTNYKNQYRIKIFESYRIGIVVQRTKFGLFDLGIATYFIKIFPENEAGAHREQFSTCQHSRQFMQSPQKLRIFLAIKKSNSALIP